MHKYTAYDKGQDEIVHFFEDLEMAEDFVRRHRKSYKKLVVGKTKAYKEIEDKLYKFEITTKKEIAIDAKNLKEAMKKAKKHFEKTHPGQAGGIRYII